MGCPAQNATATIDKEKMAYPIPTQQSSMYLSLSCPKVQNTKRFKMVMTTTNSVLSLY
jgi:hypothetical protein